VKAGGWGAGGFLAGAKVQDGDFQLRNLGPKSLPAGVARQSQAHR